MTHVKNSKMHGRVAMFTVGFMALTMPLQAWASSSAENFVASSVEQGVSILNNTTLAPSQREEQFHALLVSIIDTQRIGSFALGSYAREASKPDLETFNAAFSGYLTALYRRSLQSYEGQTLRVTGSMARSDDDSIVKAELVDQGGERTATAVAFRVRKNTAGHQIFTDLQVEGIWLAVSKRSEFTAYLQHHHGEIGHLSKELDRMSNELKSAATVE